MTTSFGFHPEALLEYAEAADYYLHRASDSVAANFVADVESAIARLAADPERCHIVEQPAIRRFVLNHFPFVIYYRWETQRDRITIYAVMHCSRKPGYWHDRI
jgi:plasmid stabilization system protein ParE